MTRCPTFAVASLALLASCSGSCRGAAALDAGPTEAPVPDAGARRTLTEADTRPLDGGVLEAEGWTLRLPTPGWQRVTDDARMRLKPDVDAWAIEPATQAHVSVACTADRRTDALDARATLTARARTSGRQLDLLTVEPLEGPWLHGAVARFETGDAETGFRHAVAFVDLGVTGCEIQAWEPRRTGPDGGQPLEAIVRAFSPAASRSLRLAARLTRRLRETPALEALLAARVDGGARPAQALATLVAQGLTRLPDSAIEERARLRLTLLERVDVSTCAALVLQHRDDAPGWLDLLTDEEAERWGALSEAALVAASSPAPPVDRAPVEALERRLERGDPDFEKALEVLKAVDRYPAAAICEAERVRLRKALAQPKPDRVTLLRGWAGP
jgi:hypothetical protein